MFIDVIDLGNGKYLKRYWKEFSGKKEIVERECSLSTYLEYRDKVVKTSKTIKRHKTLISGKI